jgi:NAD(P)H-dependent flavin oxidoreductase YrpB (nitropropane dioxygenase family)
MAGRRTRFTELVGCEWPVQLAGMGGAVGGAELAGAVHAAGGLGMVSWGEQIPAPGCGVNFLVPFVTSASQVVDAARGAAVVELFYGAPDPELVEAARRVAPVVGWQVGSAAEAAAAVEAGCDYVVAQGTEAGGHVRGREPLDVVLTAVLESVRVPVVATGGIATAERVAEVLDRGADAVRVGTRFLVCPEARAHDEYKANLLAAGDDDTVLTEWFNESWPNAPHRVLRRAFAAAQHSGWRLPLPPSRETSRAVADMAQYAGTGVGAVTAAEPAAAVVADLVRLL